MHMTEWSGSIVAIGPRLDNRLSFGVIKNIDKGSYVILNVVAFRSYTDTDDQKVWKVALGEQRKNTFE